MFGAMATAMAIMMSASASGCATVVQGNPSPTLQSRYGFEMSEADRYLIESASFVRSLDPCGFLTGDDLAVLGTLVQLRPERELSTCTAEIAKSTASGRSSGTDSITIDLNGFAPSSDDPDIERISIGGEQVSIDDSSNDSCRISFPLRAEFEGTAPASIDSFRAELGRSYATLTVYREDACTAAKPLAETVLGRLDDPPLRAGSKFDLPLASKDPCSVLDHVPAEWTTDRWSPDRNPYSCHFTASSPAFEDMLVMLDVTLESADRSTRSTYLTPVRQGGYSVLTSDLDTVCTADIVVGNPVLGLPDADDRSAGYARTTPTVAVMTDDCDSAVALAVAAADVLTG